MRQSKLELIVNLNKVNVFEGITCYISLRVQRTLLHNDELLYPKYVLKQRRLLMDVHDASIAFLDVFLLPSCCVGICNVQCVPLKFPSQSYSGRTSLNLHLWKVLNLLMCQWKLSLSNVSQMYSARNIISIICKKVSGSWLCKNVYYLIISTVSSKIFTTLKDIS